MEEIVGSMSLCTLLNYFFSEYRRLLIYVNPNSDYVVSWTGWRRRPRL